MFWSCDLKKRLNSTCRILEEDLLQHSQESLKLDLRFKIFFNFVWA